MKILFMTIGTGLGLEKEKRTQSLAHGLLEAIIHHNPEKILFFGSEESKKTIESLKAQYLEKKGISLIENEFVILDAIDDLDKCIHIMEPKFNQYKKDNIYVDYTSGTKTMTSVISLLAVLNHAKLTLISGKRGTNGIVKERTERIVDQNLYAIYDKLLIKEMKNAIESYNFMIAKEKLVSIIDISENVRENYSNLIKGLFLWDLFNHKDSFYYIEKLPSELKYLRYKQFLGPIVNNNKNDKLLIADLLNNAQRRFKEGKYDDSAARLYRTIEMIGQMELINNYNLSSGDIKIEILKTLNLKESKIDYYQSLQGEDEKIRLGLFKTFQLLADLSDNLGKKYIEDKEIQNMMKVRNNSILAHGFESISKKIAEQIYIKVKNYAEIYIGKEKLQDYLELGKF